MKQTFIFCTTVIFLFFCTQSSKAQFKTFGQGQIDLRAGVGFFSTINSLFSQSGVSGVAKSKWTTPPLSLSLDYGITEEISVGLYTGLARSTIYVYGNEAEKDKFTLIGVRGLYHLQSIPKVDAYAGGMLGVLLIRTTQPSPSGGTYTGKASAVGYQVIVGAKYKATRYVGAYAELGYGVAIVNLGLTLAL